MRTHTFQYKRTTPVPASTPPEHEPNAADGPLEPPGPSPVSGPAPVDQTEA